MPDSLQLREAFVGLVADKTLCAPPPRVADQALERSAAASIRGIFSNAKRRRWGKPADLSDFYRRSSGTHWQRIKRNNLVTCRLFRGSELLKTAP